jgi:biopolymer transport protein ExbB
LDFIAAIFDYFQKGGMVMYPLLFCSILVVWLGIERFIFYRAAESGEEFTRVLSRALSAKEYGRAKALAQETKGEAARLALSILEKGAGENPETYIAFQAERAIDRFEEYLSYIGVLVTLSPVLGLLGTITGMIASFNALDARVENPMAVTAGIGEALITTVFGLCISIAAICVHTYFAQKLKIASLNIEETGNALLAYAKDAGAP